MDNDESDEMSDSKRLDRIEKDILEIKELLKKQVL